ncbi:MAG TPA: thioredoxin domain-containing protein [Solirubrobacteraceae bacterium]|jgi:hypothetical protein|nr:thioredoxin domain-containing protein [Solirubrobacteraceae bacterium]
MPNALARETSPYLLQHKDNPVDWLPWGPEALSRSREQDKPMLVSIGYSACHWCHVMERESFEDPETARLMNNLFVCVKVDREERPDIDGIYMEAIQAMTGQGGWPLNIFLTPEQVPFFGGTYFPPEPRSGMPSFRQVLAAVAEAWEERGDEIREASGVMVERLNAGARLSPSKQPIQAAILDQAVGALLRSYDQRHGGFGGAPKFPPSGTLEFLLQRAAGHPAVSGPEAQMAVSTLGHMARGGIYDQVGGGFARYAVDASWTVPHFEKMLYDNALLARAYLHAWQLDGAERLLGVCRETLDWVLREMRSAEGGFFSALDADSDGEEGKFYVWTVGELEAALGSDADAAISYFGATEEGNFEGRNVLQAHGPEPEALDRIRSRLLQVRSERQRPGLDDKQLTSWNALMISALADAGSVLRQAEDAALRADGERYLAAAGDGAEFVLSHLRGPDGRLLRTYRNGEARLNGYLEDHGFLIEALLTLYEATFQERWFAEARALADVTIERFSDPERGGFYSTASDHESLIARRKDLEDTPLPSGASATAFGLLRLAALTGEHEYERQAVGVLRLLHEVAAQHPTAFGHLLAAIDFHTSAVHEVALVGADVGSLERVVRERWRPHLVLAAAPEGTSDAVVPLLRDRPAVDGRSAAYVCQRFTCQRPVTEPEELAALLQAS